MCTLRRNARSTERLGESAEMGSRLDGAISARFSDRYRLFANDESLPPFQSGSRRVWNDRRIPVGPPLQVSKANGYRTVADSLCADDGIARGRAAVHTQALVFRKVQTLLAQIPIRRQINHYGRVPARAKPHAHALRHFFGKCSLVHAHHHPLYSTK